jgi:hypothetical protein
LEGGQDYEIVVEQFWVTAGEGINAIKILEHR